MCGIFGMISRKPKVFNKRAFFTMGCRNDSRGGDSCGVFIDGAVEYGVDKEKFFTDFFRNSVLLNSTYECKVALGHCRKASVGKVNIETAQPVVIYNDKNEVDYVIIHNGTIYNYKELAKKYIPEIDIKGLTDSQVMARIFYHKGYDALDEYYGGAVFVIHDYRIDKTLVFKGESKKFEYSQVIEEERPLFCCWHNGRFCFSSIHETLHAFYYEEQIYTLVPNRLMVVREDKLKIVKEYTRKDVHQSRPYTYNYSENTYTYPTTTYYAPEYKYFKLKWDGHRYLGDDKKPMNGIIKVSGFGYAYPNKTKNENWLTDVAFFDGILLRSPKAYTLVKSIYEKKNKVIDKELQVLINMLNFNPYTEDDKTYFWFDDLTEVYPIGPWKWPMAEFSIDFSDEGQIVKKGKNEYIGWATDYAMYTYEEAKLLEAWKLLCEGE